MFKRKLIHPDLLHLLMKHYRAFWRENLAHLSAKEYFFELHTTLYNAAIAKMPKYRRTCNIGRRMSIQKMQIRCTPRGTT